MFVCKRTQIREFPTEIQDMIRCGVINGAHNKLSKKVCVYVVYDDKYKFYKVMVGASGTSGWSKLRFDSLTNGEFSRMLTQLLTEAKTKGMAESFSDIFIAFGCMIIVDSEKSYLYDDKGDCSII